MYAQYQECAGGYSCLACGSVLRDMGKFRRHMREVHVSRKKYRCPICDTTYFNRGFGNHARKVHAWKNVDYEKYREQT
jgi:uncharacterized C2H2 Zn-finger protein